MAISRVIEVSFRGSSVALVRIDTAYFYNNGIIFKPTDIDLPASYQVHWADSPQASSTLETIGTAEGAPIPDDLWGRSRVIYGWIYLHPTEDSGVTAYEVRIYKNVRAGLPDGTEPTPAEQSTIDQLIGALNSAVEQTGEDVESASQSARSASDDADRAERARTRSETAQGKAEEAQESAERAKDDAETSERNASESERNAKGYSETASEKADSIHSMTASAQTLPAGSSASASYDAQTGVMSFGIPKGKDGTDGDDGYSPTANVSKTGKVATITITDKNGTTSAQVEDGEDGIDGISPSVSVTDITGGHRVVITDKDGTKSFDVEDGATGATPNLTIGTVETLEPTDDATATITGTAENPVLNFGIPKGEQGEVTLEDYYKAFPTDTASGAIASFSDGADDLPLKSLIVDINPVQDLHGQDSPYPAGGGKNLCPEKSYIYGSNMYFGGESQDTRTLTLSAGTYTFSVIPSDGNPVALYFMDSTNTNVYASTGSGTSVTATFEAETEVILKVYSSRFSSGLSITKFQLEKGSTATAWSPYSNLCPISGWTEVDVEQSGVNVWDEEWEIGAYDSSTGEKYTSNVQVRAKNYIPVLPSTTYYANCSNNTSAYFKLLFYDSEKNYIDTVSSLRNNTFTTPSNAHYMTFYMNSNYGVTYNHDISINYPSTDQDYHPYSGQSVTINLGQTVYGGKLDVINGVLTVDRAGVDLGTLDWNRSNNNGVWSHYLFYVNIQTQTLQKSYMCSVYPIASLADITQSPTDKTIYGLTSNTYLYIRDDSYSDVTAFKSAVAGQQLVYELAEPIEIQLTPNQVNSLYGVNNIWADSGDTEVEYRVDTKLFIERLTAPDSADMIADANITSGKYFMVGNSLYKATANIANGGQIIVGTNCIRKSLSEALNEINA